MRKATTMTTKTAALYLVIATINGQERGIDRDLSDHAPEQAELLTPDEARKVVDQLREIGRGGYAITESRFFGDDQADDFDF